MELGQTNAYTLFSFHYFENTTEVVFPRGTSYVNNTEELLHPP